MIITPSKICLRLRPIAYPNTVKSRVLTLVTNFKKNVKRSQYISINNPLHNQSVKACVRTGHGYLNDQTGSNDIKKSKQIFLRGLNQKPKSLSVVPTTKAFLKSR